MKEEFVKKLSIRDALAAGAQLLQAKFWSYFWILFLTSFLIVLPHSVSFFFSQYLHPGPLLQMILTGSLLVALVITMVLHLGTINVLLRLLDDEEVRVIHLLSPIGNIFTYVLAAVLYAIIVSFGTFLFIIPGIIFAVMLQFIPYLIVDQKAGPLQALRASRAITAGAKRKMLLLLIILGFVQGIGIAFWWLFFIPPLLASMFVHMTYTCAYRMLLVNTPSDKLPFHVVTYLEIEEETADEAAQVKKDKDDAQTLAFNIAAAAEAMDVGQSQPAPTIERAIEPAIKPTPEPAAEPTPQPEPEQTSQPASEPTPEPKFTIDTSSTAKDAIPAEPIDEPQSKDSEEQKPEK